MSSRNEFICPVAVLSVPKRNGPFVTFARAVHDSMLNNPNFPCPIPSLAVFAANIGALEDAETKAATRAKGAAALRNAKKRRVREDLCHLRDYVQSVVETNATPANAAAVIESAFMSVKKVTKRPVPELSAKNAGVSGKVLLAAKAVAPSATYYWEYSDDQSTWNTLPDTMQSRTSLTGLTPLRVYYFRFRALTRAGQRDYSQVVSLLVL
jgi:hypothetical protein